MSPIKEYILKSFRNLIANIKSEKAEIGKDIQTLSDLVAEGLQEAGTAIDGKQKQSKKVSVTIAKSGWKLESGSTSQYKYYYDIPDESVSSKDKADIVISVSSIDTAISCGMCPVSETLTGLIRIRSAKIPDGNITAEYWVEYGKENN